MIQRKNVLGLALSAAALVGLLASEGFTDHAVIPVQGDVPTLGYGSTTHADGTPVKMGDTTTPEKALQRTRLYTQKQDLQMQKCITAPLYQGEYDVMHNFGYQYGIRRLCQSSVVIRANAEDYLGSCEAYKMYRFVGKYDCSTMVNGKRNTRCWGVWARSLDRYETCMSLQK